MPYNPPLQVVGFIGTRVSDAERGPLLILNTDEARQRLINDGELVWVYGPRRHDLTPVRRAFLSTTGCQHRQLRAAMPRLRLMWTC